MEEETQTCPRCGLRTVEHELEQHGVVMRFCDECYWGQAQGGSSPGPEGDAAPQTPGPRRGDHAA